MAWRHRWGVEVQLYSLFSLGARRGWVVNDTPRPLYPREKPNTYWIGGPTAGLDGCGKPCPHRVTLHVECPIFLFDFNQIWTPLPPPGQTFLMSSKCNFTQIRRVDAAHIYAHRRTDRHDKAYRRLLRIIRTRLQNPHPDYFVSHAIENNIKRI